MLTALVGALVAAPASAQDQPEADEPTPRAEPASSRAGILASLNRALDRRMTVWAPSRSRTVYVAHCRRARGGCAQRTASFARIITGAAQQVGIDPFLLAAVAVRESGLDPNALGAAGERGIVQLHPRGAGGSVRYVRNAAYRAHCEMQDAACQQEVLEAGARLLSRSIERCGGVREGLGAYNTGRCGETDYSRRVMRERQRLLRLAKDQNARTARDIVMPPERRRPLPRRRRAQPTQASPSSAQPAAESSATPAP